MIQNVNTTPKKPSIIFLLMATMAGIFATNLYIPSFANIVEDLQTDSQSVQLTFSVFLLFFGIFQLAHGPLSDRYGRRRLMVFGLIIFIVASFFAAVSSNIQWLMVMRVLQAIGGSCGMVLARAMVRDVYDKKQSAKIMAYVGMGSGISAAAAPLIGGLLQDITGDWRMSFYFLSIFALVPLLSVIFLVEETNRSISRSEYNFLKMLNGYFFLIKSSSYMFYTIGSGAMNTCFFSFAAAAPFILINSLNASPSRIGIILLYITIGFLVGNFISSRLSSFIKLEVLVCGGAFVCYFGVLVFSILAFLGFRSELSMSLPLSVFGLGSGFVIPPAGVIAVSIRKDIAGTASALYGFSILVMGSIGTFITGFIIHNDQKPVALMMLTFGLIAVICFTFGYFIERFKTNL